MCSMDTQSNSIGQIKTEVTFVQVSKAGYNNMNNIFTLFVKYIQVTLAIIKYDTSSTISLTITTMDDSNMKHSSSRERVSTLPC